MKLDGLLFTHYQRLPDWVKHYLTRILFKPRLGKKVAFYGNVFFGPNVSIDNYSYIHGPSQISHIKIGKYCSIARRFSVITSNHRPTEFTTYPLLFNMNSPLRGKLGGGGVDLYTLENGEIGNDVWIGEGVTMMANVKIGNGAIIGACSFVNKDIPPYAVAVGVPAKVIRYRFSDDKIQLMQTLQWWNWKPDRILREYKRLKAFDSTLLG